MEPLFQPSLHPYAVVGPFVLLLLGIGGTWAGSLTAIEPYRPVFIVIALGFLAYAFYKVHAKPKAEACDIESYCANPKSDRVNKVILWIVTFIIIGLFIFPNILPYFQRTESVATTAQTERIVLQVDNMTCAACAVIVSKSLKAVDGVVDATVSFEEKTAIVRYDPRKSGIEDLIKASTNAGYPSRILQ